jgi:hypothetical protein
MLLTPVDAEGAAVAKSGSVTETQEALQALQTRGLLTSASPRKQLDNEERAAALIAWLQGLCSRSEGLCR